MAGSPGVAVVVPVKGGARAKTRLAVDGADRSALADAFARDTVDAVRTALPEARVVVVSADPDVRGWAEAVGCTAVGDTGDGLDAAVAAGVGAATAGGPSRVAVLLGDHPALRPDELHAALEALGTVAPAVLPDADGTGTALLVADVASGGTMATRFGSGSAGEHERLGYATVVLDLPGLRTDVDDVASLAAALGLGVGRRTREVLARASLPGVQATIHRPPEEASGSALLDDGREVVVPLSAVADSGLLHLRSGQRVSIELDASGDVATRVWIVGIGPGETIR